MKPSKKNELNFQNLHGKQKVFENLIFTALQNTQQWETKQQQEHKIKRGKGRKSAWNCICRT